MLAPLPILDVAKFGIIKDLSPHRLPPGAWSDADNARFVDGYITQAMPASFYNSRALDPSAPCFLMQAFGPGQGWIAVTKNGFVYLYGSSGMMPFASHSYSPNLFWNGGMFNGFAILNNILDGPVYANYSYTGVPIISIGALPAWPADLRVRVMRPYKNFLVGLDVEISGARDKRRVRWSSSADPATLPTSWDIADATKDAGDVSLAEGTDGLLDCLPLGNANIIYGESQTWAMRYVGGQSIFAFDRLFPTSGILSTDAVTAFPRGHFVVTQDDIVVHAGDTPQSVGDMSMRRWFFKHLSSKYFPYLQVLAYKEEREIWMVYPSVNVFVNAEGFPALDTALIWNWQTNTFTLRDISDHGALKTYRVAVGYSPKAVSYTENIWDNDTGTWNSDTSAWNEESIPTRNTEGILLDQNDNWVLIDQTTEGVLVTQLERTGLAFDKDGSPEQYNYRKMVAIRPDFEAPVGTQMRIASGHQDTISDIPTWDEAKIFTVGTDVEVQVNATGRFLCLQFYILPTTKDWKFYGYYLDQAQLKEGL